MSPPGPPARGGLHIATFYSFKGGAGRSLLLANVGWVLSQRRRVVLWDLDLEAPGLHLIPALRPPDVKRGFFEWLGEWRGAQAFRTQRRLSARDAKALARLVLPVPGRPNLSILPAFGDRADFASLYAEGPWRRFVVDEPELGLSLFDAVLAVLGEGQGHVLIDSRTGITDLGGFLAALLPHATILVGGYGHQSLHGLLRVKRALEPAAEGRLAPRERLGGGARLQLVNVVSPVPEDEADSAERRRIWGEVFGGVRPIEIPFDRRLLWSERLLAADDPEGATGRAYAQVAERLSGLREELLAAAETVATEAARDPGADARLATGPRRGMAFEDRVARLLELHGYTVERQALPGRETISLVAQKLGGLEEERWIVECLGREQPVVRDILEALINYLEVLGLGPPRDRAMVVSGAFTPAAVEYAQARQNRLRIWTVEELERRLFDARPYLHTLVASYEQSALSRTYVEQRVLLEGRAADAVPVDLLAHALAWAGGEGSRLWLLLGDYGTGKTAFFQRFSAELARRALADPEVPFPIAIDLKLVANATSAETLLFEHLRQRAPSFRGDPVALLHLLSAGRCILLLDGFDEMGVAAAGRSVEEQFRELARLAGEEPIDPRRGNRVLVTCRTHFFRDQQQVKDAAAGEAGSTPAEDSALGRLARRFNAEIDELCLFDDRQIAEFLEKHLGAADAARAGEFIEATYDLPTLAPRPVLLEMIVQSLPRLWREGGYQITPAGLYEVYTRQWLEDRSGRHLQTSPVLRHRLLTLLAAVLWRRTDRQLHHRELLDEIRRLAELFPDLDHDRVDVELRSAAFLVRSADGYYRFSHKSFLEYFLARGLWTALGAGAEKGAAALDLPPLSREIGDFLWQLPDGGQQERLTVLRGILGAPYRSRISENALRLGAWSLHATAKRFHADGARLQNASLEGEDLSSIDLPAAELAAARLAGTDLAGATLRAARLTGADLTRARAAGADLTGASLAQTSLQGAHLSQAVLAGARLAKADLRGAVLDEADLTDACLEGADLRGATGDSTVFTTADLRLANLTASVWTSGRFHGALLEGAETAEWLLAEEEALPPEIPVGRLQGLEARVDLRWGHRSWSSAVAWSPDGQLLASGSQDGTARVWNGDTLELERELTGSGGAILSLAWAPAGHALAVGDESGTVRIWDGRTGELLRELAGAGARALSVAWAPAGRMLAVGARDGSVRIWDGQTGEPVRALAAPGDSVWSVAWAPAGSAVAAGLEGGTVRVWEAHTGELIQVLATSEGRVVAVAWAPSGRTLAASCSDLLLAEGKIQVWEGRDSQSNLLVPSAELAFSGGDVLSLSWAPTGRTLAAGCADGIVRVWDQFTDPPRELVASGGRVWSVAWAPSGRILAAAGDDGAVRLWGRETDQLTPELAGARARVRSVAWAPSGRELAAGSEDGTVRVWDRETGHLARNFTAYTGSVSSLAWDASGAQLAAGYSNGMVRIWHARTGQNVRSYGRRGNFLSLAWAPSGLELAGGLEGGGAWIWNLKSTSADITEQSTAGGDVHAVAWAPSGQEFATASEGAKVQVWDRRTGTEERALVGSEGCTYSVAWAPSGRELAAAGWDGVVRVWDAQTGQVVRDLPASRGRLWSVAWAPSGSEVAAGGDHGKVWVWDHRTGDLAMELAGSGARILSVAWAPSGRELAAGAEDGTVRLWDRPTGELVAVFQSWEGLGLTTVPGGWFTHSPPDKPLDPRRLRLFVATPLAGSARAWRALPLGGLARYLESPERVAASLAGQRQPAAVLPGPRSPSPALPETPAGGAARRKPRRPRRP